jgi:polysaccharide export outer membrane protein
MRILAGFLMLCLILPLAPNKAMAQLMTSPLNVSSGQAQVSVSRDSVSSRMSDTSQSIVSEDYILGAGDQLEVHLIVGDNALVLDYTFIINPAGKIFFPQVAEITLAGLTIKQAKAELTKEIQKKYKEDFDLSLMVSFPKNINVYVTGQVDSPGLRTVSDGSRISGILKGAGVAKGGSDLSEYVFLKRKNGNGDFAEYKLRLYDVFVENADAKDMPLENGDIISVPAIKSYVYVYGEVARSGTFGYVEGQRLSDYINIAGGPTDRANLSGVTVTRQENGKPKVYNIDASQIIRQGMTANDIEVIPGDVISVPGNFFYFSDFASFANTILLALTLYTAFAR